MGLNSIILKYDPVVTWFYKVCILTYKAKREKMRGKYFWRRWDDGIKSMERNIKSQIKLKNKYRRGKTKLIRVHTLKI